MKCLTDPLQPLGFAPAGSGSEGGLHGELRYPNKQKPDHPEASSLKRLLPDILPRGILDALQFAKGLQVKGIRLPSIGAPIQVVADSQDDAQYIP